MSVLQGISSRVELTEAYEHCRRVARKEAKNFYYAFLALPQQKRDSMCAMYAFMRRADDIADDECMPVAERRALMTRWTATFRTNGAFCREDAAVFTAVRDTQQRFGIADKLLDDLVSGTAMDLQEEAPAGVSRIQVRGKNVDLYTSLESLDQYCYLVASVVGLVTIRIFGVDGTGADEDAIAMGKAFQYTNILRDVREDAERQRIYLPLDLLLQHNATPEDVIDAATQQQPGAPLLAAMQSFAARAETFYESEKPLLLRLHADSRGAMRTLIAIYHALLYRIEHVRLQVFGERVRVSTARKVALLLRGVLLGSHT